MSDLDKGTTDEAKDKEAWITPQLTESTIEELTKGGVTNTDSESLTAQPS